MTVLVLNLRKHRFFKWSRCYHNLSSLTYSSHNPDDLVFLRCRAWTRMKRISLRCIHERVTIRKTLYFVTCVSSGYFGMGSIFNECNCFGILNGAYLIRTAIILVKEINCWNVDVSDKSR